MSKRELLLIIIMILLSICLNAELNQLRIIGQAEKTADIVPVRYQTVNRERAACIIFVTDLNVDLDFRPRVELVALVEPAPGEFLVYVAPGERVITVHALGYEPMPVVLREYGISVLRSGDVYRIRLTGDRPEGVRGIESININVQVTPSDATVYLNEQIVQDTRRIPARVGFNQIRIERDRYRPISKEIDVNENNTFFEFDLELSMDVPVTINSNPDGAKVFINDVERGVTPTQFFHPEGKFRIYVEGFGAYSSIDEEIEIEAPQTVKNYNLRQNTGTVAVNVIPIDASISLRGREDSFTAQGSNVFRDIPAGSYEVEITAPDHKTHKEGILLRTDETLTRQYILERLTVETVVERAAPPPPREQVEVTTRETKRYEIPEIDVIRSKRNFWRTNKWIGLTGTVLTIGTAVYFDMQGQSYTDDYNNATTPADREAAWEDVENSLDARNITFYVSAAPAIYTVVSWMRERSFNRRLK